MKTNSILSRTVWVVALVSLFTDVSSEMLYPVMPVYLKTIGFSALYIGILEGMTELISGFSKTYFGLASDHSGKRVVFVRSGYLLSAISKPMLALSVFPLWIFSARFADRMGKGLRTSARDAILSSESSKETKGKVFGFHRGMDTVGAAIGPFAALIYLYFYPSHYKELFIIAFIPAMVGVLFTFLIKDKQPSRPIDNSTPKAFFLFEYWRNSPAEYKKVVAGFLVFTAVNSSDMFLLLKVKSLGLPDAAVIGLYIFYNLVYAVSSFPIGALADKLGMKLVFIAGLILFSMVYICFAFAHTISIFIFLFFIYGIFAASTEGISKAWISNLIPQKETASAIGFYSGWASVGTMLASIVTGLIWVNFSSTVAFLGSGFIAFCAAIYFGRFTSIKKPQNDENYLSSEI